MSALEKRGENSYRITVSCGYDKEGKQIVKRKTIDLSEIKPNASINPKCNKISKACSY